jgi:hypothetical protein
LARPPKEKTNTYPKRRERELPPHTWVNGTSQQFTQSSNIAENVQEGVNAGPEAAAAAALAARHKAVLVLQYEMKLKSVPDNS